MYSLGVKNFWNKSGNEDFEFIFLILNRHSNGLPDNSVIIDPGKRFANTDEQSCIVWLINL